MEASREEILWNGYGLKLLGDTRIRTGRVCKTDCGIKELKKLNCDEKRAVFVHNVKEYVYSKGFQNIRRFISTNEGLPYFKTDDAIYVLEDYEEMEYIDFENHQNIMEIMKLIADFHNASEGFECDCEAYINSDYNEMFEKRLRELKHIAKWIYRQNNKSQVDMIVLENMRYYEELAYYAKDILSSNDYGSILAAENMPKTVCHNNLKSETLLKGQKNILITGFEKSAFGTPEEDLAEFIRRFIKYQNPDEFIINDMIKAYSSVRPISQNQYNVIKGLLIFPKKFFKLCNQYYNKKRVYVSDAMLEKFKSCVEQKYKTQLLMEKLIG